MEKTEKWVAKPGKWLTEPDEFRKWAMKSDEARFLESRTQMPATMQQMYDYDSMLDSITEKIGSADELDVNERLLLYNFLEDLKLYRKFCGPFSGVVERMKKDVTQKQTEGE